MKNKVKVSKKYKDGSTEEYFVDIEKKGKTRNAKSNSKTKKDE